METHGIRDFQLKNIPKLLVVRSEKPANNTRTGKDAHPTRLDSERESVPEGTSAAASSSSFLWSSLILYIYSGFRSYEVHLSPLIACGEGVGGGVLIPHNTWKCCIQFRQPWIALYENLV